MSPSTGSLDDVKRLLHDARSAMKSDPASAVGALERALAIARTSGGDDDVAVVAEELARGWARRRSSARSLHHARMATRLSPGQKASWTTLAKTCELVAAKTRDARKQRRARALYRGAATAFEKAASLTKDAEDRRWLRELAGDAARQAAAPPAR